MAVSRVASMVWISARVRRQNYYGVVKYACLREHRSNLSRSGLTMALPQHYNQGGYGESNPYATQSQAPPAYGQYSNQSYNQQSYNQQSYGKLKYVLHTNHINAPY